MKTPPPNKGHAAIKKPPPLEFGEPNPVAKIAIVNEDPAFHEAVKRNFRELFWVFSSHLETNLEALRAEKPQVVLYSHKLYTAS
jgi:hypothetical protein